MEYRHLGRSGLQVSAVGLGTNNFGGRMDARASARVVDASLDQGINLIDTANIYGGSLSEEYIGKALKGKRDEALIATKVAGNMGEGPNLAGLSRQHIMSEVENSLRRLQTDYIDLYQTHFVDPETPIEETMRALDDLVRQGKVRYVGCSNYAPWQICEAIWASRNTGLSSYVSVQPDYSMINRVVEAELLPFCEQYGLGVLPYFPLASGFLTGKYRRDQPGPEGARLSGDGWGMLTDENFDLLESVEKFASDREHTVLELAFAYLLAHRPVSSVIAGATSEEQVASNVSAGEWQLTPDDLEALEPLLANTKTNDPLG